MIRLLIGSSVAAVVLVAAGTTASRTIAAGQSVADPSGRSDDNPIVLSARLSSIEVVPQSGVLPSGATGRLTGRLTTYTPSGVYFWPPRATMRLRFTGLSGPPIWIAIRFGERGETGHVWYLFCGVHAGACPQRQHGVVLGQVGVYGGVATLTRHPFYVEIATGRNLRGELRGQIEFRRR